MREHGPLADIRYAFATAENAQEWSELIARVEREFSQPVSRSSREQLQLVRAASFASYYAHLLRDSSRADTLQSAVESLVENEDDPEAQRRLSLVHLTGKHRLTRNRHASGGTPNVLGVSRALRDLVGAFGVGANDDDLLDAELEIVHAQRNSGDWKGAADRYLVLARRLNPSDDLRAIALFHYGTSLVCDFVELALAPHRRTSLRPYVGAPDAVAKALEEMAGDGLLEAIKRIRSVLPAQDAVEQYPTLGGLLIKHDALWTAWTESAEAGVARLKEARARLDLFRPLVTQLPGKLQLLCDYFAGLIRLRQGDVQGAICDLEVVSRDADGYYPRLKARTDTYRTCLRGALGQPIRQEEVRTAIRAYNRLDSQTARFMAGTAAPAAEDSDRTYAPIDIPGTLKTQVVAWFAELRRTLVAQLRTPMEAVPASGFGNVAIDVPWWAGNNETVAGGRSLGERDRPAAAVQAAGHGSQADFGQSRPAKDSNVHTRFHGPRMELGIMLAELEAVTGETAPSISGTPWLTLRKNWVISLLGIIGVVGLVASFVEPWRTDVLLRACLVVSSLLCVVPIVALVSKSIALAARINRAGAELLATKR